MIPEFILGGTLFFTLLKCWQFHGEIRLYKTVTDEQEVIIALQNKMIILLNEMNRRLGGKDFLLCAPEEEK